MNHQFRAAVWSKGGRPAVVKVTCDHCGATGEADILYPLIDIAVAEAIKTVTISCGEGVNDEKENT